MIYAIIASVIMPIIASSYEMMRKPEWHKDIRPKWLYTNMLSGVFGIIMGLASAYMLHSSNASAIIIGYVSECISMISWCVVSCTITDFSSRKIDRHVMRFIYTSQFIISSWYIYMMGFSLNNIIIMAITMLACISTGYIKFLKFGASDARCLAAMIACTYPVLGMRIIQPIIISMIAIFITGIIVLLVESKGNMVYSYDSHGSVIQQKIDSGGARKDPRVSSRKSMMIADITTPAGHALTIPFLIYMLLTLL